MCFVYVSDKNSHAKLPFNTYREAFEVFDELTESFKKDKKSRPVVLLLVDEENKEHNAKFSLKGK